MEFIDQMGEKVELKQTPQRIVSLVPSQTELLSDLGLEDEVVGITKFCVHPAQWRKSKKIIGGTKQFDLAGIEALQPDLIIGNKEENYQSGIEALKNKFPVWMSNVVSFEDALAMIRSIGGITGRQEKGDKIADQIQAGFAGIAPRPKPRTLYLIWRKPWRAAGAGTFINAILEKAGFENVLGQTKRYPELTVEAMKTRDPSIVMLSSEPFPFNEKHIEEITKLLPKAKVVLVNGEMFSWYGSRLLRTQGYINSLRF